MYDGWLRDFVHVLYSLDSIGPFAKLVVVILLVTLCIAMIGLVIYLARWAIDKRSNASELKE